MSDQNKSPVCRFVDEMLNRQNPAVIDELVSPDFVDHDAPLTKRRDRKASSSLWQWSKGR